MTKSQSKFSVKKTSHITKQRIFRKVINGLRKQRNLKTEKKQKLERWTNLDLSSDFG